MKAGAGITEAEDPRAFWVSAVDPDPVGPLRPGIPLPRLCSCFRHSWCACLTLP